MRRLRKIVAFTISFCFLLEQVGFAQVPGRADLSGLIGSIGSMSAQDRYRPLHLRYLQYLPGNDSFKLLLDKGSSSPTPGDMSDASRQLLKYFFTGTVLPGSVFWVNLRPDSSDNMIDSGLEGTDVGRILLEADLQLKKDTAKATSPDTAEGRKYWDRLYRKAEELLGPGHKDFPTLVRPWIVPDEVIVGQTKDSTYVYKATLKICLEQDYLKVRPAGETTDYSFSDPRFKELNEYSAALIRELILPRLTRELNTSKRYAPLRQVFYSLILAKCFKAKFRETGGAYARLIDNRDTEGLCGQPWSKDSYFSQYRDSFHKGEYSSTFIVNTALGRVSRTCVSGGVNLDLPVTMVDLSARGELIPSAGFLQPVMADGGSGKKYELMITVEQAKTGTPAEKDGGSIEKINNIIKLRPLFIALKVTSSERERKAIGLRIANILLKNKVEVTPAQFDILVSCLGLARSDDARAGYAEAVHSALLDDRGLRLSSGRKHLDTLLNALELSRTESVMVDLSCAIELCIQEYGADKQITPVGLDVLVNAMKRSGSPEAINHLSIAIIHAFKNDARLRMTEEQMRTVIACFDFVPGYHHMVSSCLETAIMRTHELFDVALQELGTADPAGMRAAGIATAFEGVMKSEDIVLTLAQLKDILECFSPRHSLYVKNKLKDGLSFILPRFSSLIGMVIDKAKETESDPDRNILAEIIKTVLISDGTLKLDAGRLDDLVSLMESATVAKHNLALCVASALANNPLLVDQAIGYLRKVKSENSRGAIAIAISEAMKNDHAPRLWDGQKAVIFGCLESTTSRDVREYLAQAVRYDLSNYPEASLTLQELHTLLGSLVRAGAHSSIFETGLCISMAVKKSPSLVFEVVAFGRKAESATVRKELEIPVQMLVQSSRYPHLYLDPSAQTDWSLIMRSIPSEYAKGLFGGDNARIYADIMFVSDSAQSTLMAMKLKQQAYCKYLEGVTGKKAPEMPPIDPRKPGFPLLVALYKMPWEKFFPKAVSVGGLEMVHQNPLLLRPKTAKDGGRVLEDGGGSGNLSPELEELLADEDTLYFVLAEKFDDLCYGLDWSGLVEEARKIARDPTYMSPKLKADHVVLLRQFFASIGGKKQDFTRQDRELIQKLSIEVNKCLENQRKLGKIHPSGKMTFRESARFNNIFSRYYLTDPHGALANVFKYFVLTSGTVYGRYIEPEDRDEFIRTLKNVFSSEQYRPLYSKSSIEAGQAMSDYAMNQLLDYGTFEEPVAETLPLSRRKILAAAERARSVGMALFYFLPKAQFPDIVVKSLSADERNEVFPLSLNGFTQRSEFFGRDLPAEDMIRWFNGTLGRLIEYAEAHPDKRIYLVLENPDFLAGDVRMALHPFLLERRVILQRQNKDGSKQSYEVTVPPNLHTVLTMEAGGDIGDESFMDRAVGCYLDVPSGDELRRYLTEETGVSADVAGYLQGLYAKLLADEQLRELFTLQDILQIGYYVHGRVKDNHLEDSEAAVAGEEAALHLCSKLSPVQQKEELARLLAVLGQKKTPHFSVKITEDAGALIFSGIRIDIDPSSAFGRYLKTKTPEELGSLTFGKALEEFNRDDEYFLTPMEERTFCLLARVYKYAPSKVLFLQGPSGEGKTTISRVFLDVIGAHKEEYVINRKIDLTMFRGSLALGKGGIEMRVPRYWKKLGQDLFAPIYNEPDTRIFLFQWLWPHIVGRDYRLGEEFPARDGRLFDRKDFGGGQIHILTGNARNDIPGLIAANIPATYCLEGSPDDTYAITEKMFRSQAAKLGLSLNGELGAKSRELSVIFNSLRHTIRKGEFSSGREITRRELKRFSRLLLEGVKNGKDLDRQFNFLLELFFVRMWETQKDMDLSRQIISTHFTDLSPPSNDELLAFVRDFPLDTPVLILSNNTVSFDEIRGRISAPSADIDEHTVLLSHFHNNRSLIGGISRNPGDTSLDNKLGVLPSLIMQAHLTGRRQVCWVSGYLNLDPRVAPLLNEFFQTNWLPVEEIFDSSLLKTVLEKTGGSGAYPRLAAEYAAVTGERLPDDPGQLENGQRESFVRFVLGYKPKNLIFRVLGTADERIALHAADVDRFLTVNISEEVNADWLAAYVKKTSQFDGGQVSLAGNCVVAAWRLYERQKYQGLYPHNRFHKRETDVFLREVERLRRDGMYSETAVRLLAYLILGSGLARDDRPEADRSAGRAEDFRAEYARQIGLDPEAVTYERRFTRENDGIYFTVEAKVAGRTALSVKHRTKYADFRQIDGYGRFEFTRAEGSRLNVRLQAPLQSLLAQQLGTLLFHRSDIPVILEGDPGGGKTSSLRDLARACGINYHEEGMYKWIDLSALLGSLSMRGKDILLTALDKDKEGRYLLPFLRLYSEGGIYVADEGMVSENAGQLLRWITQAAALKEIDLGSYHPGLQGIVLKRHPDFSFHITQNRHFSTQGRRPLPYEIDIQSGKVRVDNQPSYDDVRSLIDYFLEGAVIRDEIKDKLAKLHLHMCEVHPQKRMISPRDLIDVIAMLRENGAADEKSVYTAVSVNYLEGLLEPEEIKTAEQAVRDVFPDFSRPDYSDVSFSRHGVSNLDAGEIEHLRTSTTMMSKAAALEKILSTTGRQVLIYEERGGMGVELVKLLCSLTGRDLDIFEGHPFVTAKMLLSGESFKFNGEFEAAGRRTASGEFGVTRGGIGRYMVREDKLALVPPEKRKPVIIAIPNVDSIPTAELVKLNELVTTRSAPMQDDDGKLATFVLPDWVTIVPITSEMDSLSSPFANRFRKVGLPFLRSSEEWHEVLTRLYPDISGQETALLYDIARRASEACRQDRFEIGYEFCPRDLFELALRVQMFKQNDGASAQNANPAWYAFKAVYYVYLRAMAPEDRAKFIDEVLAPALSAKAAQDVPAAQVRAYCRFLLDEIAKVSRDIVTEDFTVDIPEGKLTGQFYYLDNGIAVRIKDGKLNVVTSHVYSVDMENVPRAGDEPYPLSDGIGVSRNGKGIRLTLKLLSKVGGIPLNNGPENKRYSVPIGEAGSDEYLHLADPLKDALTALFQAQTPVKAANGKYVMPRMILMPGETGTGKTTIPKWIGRVAGIPLVRINPHKKMHGSEMTFSYSLGETIELDISEFLLACGKVNGRRIVSGMPTSDRLIIFIDEANITRDVWYLLDAIARGETSFRVETPAGEAVTVELDRQICVILNYNPPEHYGGTGKHGNRYLFPEGVQARSVKVYVDEPLATYTGKEMQAILEGIYSRGEAYAERQELLEGTKPPARAGGFTAVKPEPFHVGSLGLPGQQPLDSLKEDIVRQNVPSQDDGKGGPKKKALSADEIAKRKEEFLKRHSFDPAALDNALAETASFFATEKKTSLRYLYLSAKVLRPLFTGLALGAVPSKSMEKALVLCAQVSGKLPDIIQSFTKEIASETVSRRRIEILLGQLDNASQELDVFLEHMGVEVLGGKPFIAFAPCAIAGRKDIDRGRLKALLGGDYAKIFADDMVPSGLVLGRVSQDGIVGYKTGKFVVITFVGDEKQEDDIFFHEFGHMTTNRLAKFDRRFRERLHKNIELYSVFFPLIFSADPAGYLQGDLRADLGRISAERARDAYALAAKAALNAFAVDLNLDRIDNFEPDRIERIISEVSKYEPERIREMAVKLFRDPEKYFKDVEAGVYYAKTLTANIGGVSMAFSYAQTTEDDIVRPRVEYQEIEGADQGEAEEKPDNSGFLDDRERGSGKEAELPGSSAFWEKKYRELFAPDIDDSSEVVFVPTGGPDINPEAVAGNDSSRLFVLPAYEDETKGLAQNIFFIVDVSGSIQGDYEQQQLLEEIISRHSAFLLSLSKSNPDLNIAIGAISSKMDILFDFRAWKNAGTQDAKRRLLKKALADMWHVGNGSGIETGSILDTLSKTDFPRASGKDTKNLVVVYTDGEETGPRGESLRKKIEEFSDGRRREGGSKRGGRIDFVFMGGNLGNYGQALRDSYPAWLHLEGSDITPDTFLEALCKISYLQTRNKLEGDLSRISFKGGAKDGGQQDIGLLIEDMKNSSVNDTKYQRALRLFRIDVRDRPGSKITREQMDGLFTVLKKSDPNGPVSRMELLEIIGALLGRDIGFQVTKEQAGILLESFMEEGLVRRVWGDAVGAALISNPALLEIVISAIKETYSTAVRSDLSFSVSMALAAGLKLSQEQLDILFGLFNPGEDQGSYHREFSCLLACALRNDRTLKVQPGNMDLLLAALFIDFYNSDGVEKAIGEAASTDPGLMEQVFKALNNAGSDYRRINLLSAIHTALENHKDLKLSAAQHDSLTALLDGQKDQYFNGKVGKTLSQALINDPAFVERVFDILDKAEPGTRRNELIQVLVRVSDKLQYAHRFITPTQQTDRTLILNSIPDPLLDPFFSQTDGKAYADIMLPVDKTEATVAAMGLKKAIYRRYIKKELGSDPGEQAIDPMKEGFALLVALYKMPWDKFMAKMNACGGYAKVHADPLLLRSKAAADGGESWRDKKFAGILDIYLESEAEESAYAWRLGQMLKDEPGLLEDFFTVHFGKADSDIARGRLANVVKELYRLDFMQKSELARLKPAQVNVLVSALAQVESDSARSALSESIGKSLENNPQLLDGILDRIAEPSLTEPLASVVAGVLRRNRSLILSAVRFDGILELAIAAENGLYGAGRGLENILSEAIINDPGSLINHVFSLLRKGDQQTQACLAKALADTVQPIRQRVHLSSVEVNTLLNVALDQPPFFIRKEDWDSGKLVEALKTAMLSQTIQTNAFGAIAGALAGDPELSLSGGQVDTLLLVFDKENEYSAVRRAIVDVLSASLINRPSALGAIMAHIKANKSDDGRAGLVWAVRKALVGSFSLRLSPEYLNDLIDLMGETKSDRALEAFSETIRIAKREAPFGLTPARADIVFDCFGRTASDEAGENLCGILLNAFFNELFVYTVTPDRIEKFFAWFVRTRSDKAKETAAALIRQVLSKTDGRLTHSQTGSLIDALFAAQSSSEMGLFRDCIEWAVEKDPALIGAVLKRLDMQGLGRSFLLGACRNLVAGLAIKLSPEQLEVFVGCLSSLRAANNKADAGLAQQIISDALNANPVLLVDIVERLNQPGSAAVRNDLVAAVQLAATRMMFRGYTSSHMMTSSKDRDDPDGLAGVHYPHQYFTAPRQTDWSIMFSSIPADICGKVFLPQGGADYLSIMLDTEKARSTVNAMRLKQNAYREYIGKMNGKDPGEQPIDPKKPGFALLVALYKMPWDKFLAKMEAAGGYAAVHQDYTRLSPKIAKDGGMEDASDLDSVLDTFNGSFNPGLASKILSVLKGNDRLRVSAAQVDKIFKIFTFFFEKDRGYPGYQEEEDLVSIVSLLIRKQEVVLQPDQFRALIGYMSFYNSDNQDAMAFIIEDAVINSPALIGTLLPLWFDEPSVSWDTSWRWTMVRELLDSSRFILAPDHMDTLVDFLDQSMSGSDKAKRLQIEQAIKSAAEKNPGLLGRVVASLIKVKSDDAREALVKILVSLSVYPHKYLTGQNATDWSLILDSIPEDYTDRLLKENKGDAYREILLAAGNTQLSIRAMEWKQLVYRESLKQAAGKDPGEQPIDPQKPGFSLLVALYKMPWEKFLAKIEACGGYAAVHADYTRLSPKIAKDGGRRSKKDIYNTSYLAGKIEALKLASSKEEKYHLKQEITYTLHVNPALYKQVVAALRVAGEEESRALVYALGYALRTSRATRILRGTPEEFDFYIALMRSAYERHDEELWDYEMCVEGALRKNPQMMGRFFAEIKGAGTVTWRGMFARTLVTSLKFSREDGRPIVLAQEEFGALIDALFTIPQGVTDSKWAIDRFEESIQEALWNDLTLVSAVRSSLGKREWPRLQPLFGSAFERCRQNGLYPHEYLGINSRTDWSLVLSSIPSDALHALIKGDEDGYRDMFFAVDNGQVTSKAMAMKQIAYRESIKRAGGEDPGEQPIDPKKEGFSLLVALYKMPWEKFLAKMEASGGYEVVHKEPTRLSAWAAKDGGEEQSLKEKLEALRRVSRYGIPRQLKEDINNMLLNSPELYGQVIAALKVTTEDSVRDVLAEVLIDAFKAARGKKYDLRLSSDDLHTLIAALDAAKGEFAWGNLQWVFINAIDAVKNNEEVYKLMVTALKETRNEAVITALTEAIEVLLRYASNGYLHIKVTPEEMDILVHAFNGLTTTNILKYAISGNPALYGQVISGIKETNKIPVKDDLAEALADSLESSNSIRIGFSELDDLIVSWISAIGSDAEYQLARSIKYAVYNNPLLLAHVTQAYQNKPELGMLKKVIILDYGHIYEPTDWSLVIDSIPEEQFKEVVNKTDSRELVEMMRDSGKSRATPKAMLFRQQAYRKHIERTTGKDPGEQAIDPQRPGFGLLVALYKMPWEKFLAKMEAAGGYAVVHQDYTRLSPKLAKDGGEDAAGGVDFRFDNMLVAGMMPSEDSVKGYLGDCREHVPAAPAAIARARTRIAYILRLEEENGTRSSKDIIETLKVVLGLETAALQ